MSLHVTCGRTSYSGTEPSGLQLEIAGALDWSETLTVAGTSTNSVPEGQQPRALTLTARVDMFVAIAAVPNAGVNPRYLMVAGQSRTYLALPGQKVAWVAG